MPSKLEIELAADEAGILRSNLSWATLTLQAVATILRMPPEMTMNDLPTWASHVMRGKRRRRG